MESAEMKKVLDAIVIPYAEAVRGNITLPTELGEAKLVWKSSNPTVITDEKVGAASAGVVTRQAKDCTVTLTVTVTLGAEQAKKELPVLVFCCTAKAYRG